eukprot:m.777530 g.777530  ORF g.777530 m.777530 type:complete len:80 (-) comp23265_c1_seq8:114-353(-)
MLNFGISHVVSEANQMKGHELFPSKNRGPNSRQHRISTTTIETTHTTPATPMSKTFPYDETGLCAWSSVWIFNCVPVFI